MPDELRGAAEMRVRSCSVHQPYGMSRTLILIKRRPFHFLETEKIRKE